MVILESCASGKSLRSYHGTAEGIGGRGLHGIYQEDNEPLSYFSASFFLLQLSGEFMFAGLGSLPCRMCTPLSTGWPFVMGRPLGMYAYIYIH